MQEVSDLKFTSANGAGRPSTQARRYVYQILVAMLDAQLNHHPENIEGWMFGGIEHEADRRRVSKEIRRCMADFARRGGISKK